MAFDHPLEADRVDLNLFSTIIRAPVVGALFWFLGGEEAKEKEQEEKQFRDILLGKVKASDKVVDRGPSNPQFYSSGLQKPCLKKGAPSMVGSEVSDDESMAECSESLCRMNLQNHPNPLRRKKELSWSDESGHSLVEYVGEQSVEDNAVRVSDTTTESRPIGGLSRSRSIRANANSMALTQEDDVAKSSEPRYLPRGLDKAHNGIIIPRMPYGTAFERTNSHDGGVDSPQWGWFLRTTPPTPQMYYPRPTGKVNGYSGPADAGYSITRSSEGCSHPNPVFQGLQDKHEATPMGWSSVPL